MVEPAGAGNSAHAPSRTRDIIRALSSLPQRHPLLVKTLRNLTHLAGGNASAAALNALVLVIMARMLGPAMLGVFAMIESYGTVIDQLVRLETWQPLIRYGTQALEDRRPGRFLALVKLGILADLAGAALAAGVAFAAVPLAGYLLSWDPATATMARWYCLAVLAGISSTPVGILRVFDRFRQFAWLEPATALVRLAAVALAFWLHGSIGHLLLIFIAVQWLYRIALGMLAWFELRRQGYGNPFSAPLAELRPLARGYWRLTIATNAAALVRKSTQELDVLIVGSIAGAAVVGIYDLVRRITTAAVKTGTMVQQVALPDLSRLWARRDVKGFKSLVGQIELLTVLAGVAFVVLVAVGGDRIIAILAGPRFAAAATPLLVQSIAGCLFLCGSAIRPALITMGSETRLLGIVLISATAFYITLFLAVPQLGAVGASAAHVAFNIMLLPLGGLAFAAALRAPASQAKLAQRFSFPQIPG
jgi:O-antigen/teichoic acid export membrane protein